MKTYDGMEVEIVVFLTPALDNEEWNALGSGKITRWRLTRGLVELQGRSRSISEEKSPVWLPGMEKKCPDQTASKEPKVSVILNV